MRMIIKFFCLRVIYINRYEFKIFKFVYYQCYCQRKMYQGWDQTFVNKMCEFVTIALFKLLVK